MITWAFAMLSKAGLKHLLQIKWFYSLVTWLFMNLHIGSDKCAIAVRALGRDKAGNSRALTIAVVGRREAQMTAIVAAETVRQMVTNDLPAGVLHSEQIIELEPILVELKRKIPKILISI